MMTLHTPETLAAFQKMQDEIEQKSINQLTYALHRIATADMIKWDADTEEEFQREFLPWAQQIARDAIAALKYKDFKESMDDLPQELVRVYGKAWRNAATLDDLTAADARRHRESQREAAESADEKPDGQAENANLSHGDESER